MPRVPSSDAVAPQVLMGPGPSPTDFALAAAMMHEEGRFFEPEIKVAGDVVPLPMSAGELSNASRTGHTNKSAPYVMGKEADPKIKPIPMNTWKGWMDRTSSRK